MLWVVASLKALFLIFFLFFLLYELRQIVIQIQSYLEHFVHSHGLVYQNVMHHSGRNNVIM